jgi:hypothetical protein
MSRPGITLPVPASSRATTTLTCIAALPPSVVLMVGPRAGWERKVPWAAVGRLKDLRR